jgi:hypothetical protein
MLWRMILLVVTVLGTGLTGCASVMPPSESTITILQSYRADLQKRVASKQLTPSQARDEWYGRLAEVSPPLPELNDLQESRARVEAKVKAGVFTPEQADGELAVRETDMLAHWEDMAARYAKEQRKFDQSQTQYERGFREQQQPYNRR